MGDVAESDQHMHEHMSFAQAWTDGSELPDGSKLIVILDKDWKSVDAAIRSAAIDCVPGLEMKVGSYGKINDPGDPFDGKMRVGVTAAFGSSGKWWNRFTDMLIDRGIIEEVSPARKPIDYGTLERKVVDAERKIEELKFKEMYGADDRVPETDSSGEQLVKALKSKRNADGSVTLTAREAEVLLGPKDPSPDDGELKQAILKISKEHEIRVQLRTKSRNPGHREIWVGGQVKRFQLMQSIGNLGREKVGEVSDFFRDAFVLAGSPFTEVENLVWFCFLAQRQEDDLRWKAVPNPQQTGRAFVCLDVPGRPYDKDDPSKGRQLPEGVVEHVLGFMVQDISQRTADAAVRARDWVLEKRAKKL